MEEIKARMTELPTLFTSLGNMTVIRTYDHGELKNRDAADQHPMSSITGLEDALKNVKGAPSDWNANEGEDGHILNRTHYSVKPAEVVLDTAQVTFNGGMTEFMPGALPLVVGNMYTFEFDGVAYECDCFAAELQGVSCLVIGNRLAIGTDTGEPIIIFTSSSMNMWGVAAAIGMVDGSVHTLKIFDGVEEVHQIPRKYVKDIAPLVVEISDTGNTGTPTANVTVSELVQAFENKRTIVAKVNYILSLYLILDLVSVWNDNFVFHQRMGAVDVDTGNFDIGGDIWLVLRGNATTNVFEVTVNTTE